MSQRLGPVGRRDLIKTLRRLGWSGPWHGSKHQMMHKGKRKRVKRDAQNAALPLPVPFAAHGWHSRDRHDARWPAAC